MKEKMLQVKEKIMQNKRTSGIVAVCVIAVIVMAVISGMSMSDKKDESSKNTATGSSGNLAKNESSKSGRDGKKDDDTENASESDNENGTGENESDTSAGDENGEQSSVGENGETAENGSAGNNGTGGNSSGNNNGSTGNTGGNSGNAGGSAGNTGGSNTGVGNTGENGGNTGTNGGSGNVTGPDTPQPNQNTLYTQLFDINNKVTITLEISDAEIQKLQADYKKYGNGKSPIYRKADKMTVTVAGRTYEMYEIGVRMKGNTSRCNVYNGGDVNNRNLIHLRLSFDETFDDTSYYGADAKKWSSDAARKERKKRTFAGLDCLELKWNRNFDGTYITNYYANQMFKEMGVLAQSMNLANINFGGYNYGVYSIYEPVDDKFIERYLPVSEWGGDLYKCGWGSGRGADYTSGSLGSIGVSTEYRAYTYDLKTNKKSSNHSSLKKLINVLNSNPSKEAFASVVDTDYWAKFAAASYFAGNCDDMRNNYNNHYVYFLKSSGKAIFIPYDYDRAFGVTHENQDIKMYEANPFSEYAKLANSGQNNPLYRYSVIRKNNSSDGNYFSAEYKQQLARAASGRWMNYSTFQNLYNTVRNNYSSVVIPSSNVKAYTYGSFENTNNLAFNENFRYRRNTTAQNFINGILNTYRNAQ